MGNVGLVLEGGGMRGVYTGGILDYFMEADFYLNYVIGVSAGACNAVSYVSKQKGRNKKVTIDYIDDPNYISYRNLIRHGFLLNMDMIFYDIPMKQVPFDFDTYERHQMECVIGVTNCITGKAQYFNKSNSVDLLQICRASSSLPFISPVVYIDDIPYLDGGISDSIPIKKSIEDGNRKNIIILTRGKEYRKKKAKINWITKRKYKDYPALQNLINNRYLKYNETLDYIDQLEKDGKAFVIRPTVPVDISRTEKNKDKLIALYNSGYDDAKNNINMLKKWMNEV